MDQFVQEFYEKQIRCMTETEFKKLKDAYGYTVMKTQELFKEIVKSEFVFNRPQREV